MAFACSESKYVRSSKDAFTDSDNGSGTRSTNSSDASGLSPGSFKLLQSFVTDSDHVQNVFVAIIRANAKSGPGVTMQDFENKLGKDLSLVNVTHQYAQASLKVSQFVECLDNDAQSGGESKITNATQVFTTSIAGQASSDLRVNNECAAARIFKDSIAPNTYLDVVFEFNREANFLADSTGLNLELENDVKNWLASLKQSQPNFAGVRLYWICKQTELSKWQHASRLSGGVAIDYMTTNHQEVFLRMAKDLIGQEKNRVFDISEALQSEPLEKMIVLHNNIILQPGIDFVWQDKSLRLNHNVKLKKSDVVKIGVIEE